MVSPNWNNGLIVDAGAATFGPSGGISGSITATNRRLEHPGSVEAISERFTTDNALVVSTSQNRVLQLRVRSRVLDDSEQRHR